MHGDYLAAIQANVFHFHCLRSLLLVRTLSSDPLAQSDGSGDLNQARSVVSIRDRDGLLRLARFADIRVPHRIALRTDLDGRFVGIGIYVLGEKSTQDTHHVVST